MSENRWLPFLMVTCALSACGSPEPESECFSSADCGPETPVCSPAGSAGRLCSHECATTADCADLALQTSCDTGVGLCAPPCTSDSVGEFACVDGERVYCEDDPTLSCAICPNACGVGSYCDGMACQPLHAAGDACTQDSQCASRACTDAGQCSLAQGEACTPENCEGACAERHSGETLCIRSRCPANCAESTAGGLEWYCARYDSYEACVPLESCIWRASCSTFVDATCGQACRSGGGCWTYCVPNEISTDDD